MGDSKAFLTIHRQEAGYRPVHERITDYGEVEQTLNTCLLYTSDAADEL